ncbi:MAG TPA: oligopeptide/dipeptide ABC transporter ATP-binding protein, partial [Ideonella sp.]|nr:oligopeptide/dipeptide ABC transporter ATP-binding protein [Ideonella sp.]
RDLSMALLLITHDLGVVAQVADRAAVMYAGRIVEEAPVAQLFAQPQHPYTAGLIGAVALDAVAPGSRLPEIGGTVPSLLALPAGCAFAPRCARAADPCLREAPPLQARGASGHRSACFAPLTAAQPLRLVRQRAGERQAA